MLAQRGIYIIFSSGLSYHLICLVIFLVNLLSWTNTVFFIIYVQTVDQQDLISMGEKNHSKRQNILEFLYFFNLIWFSVKGSVLTWTILHHRYWHRQIFLITVYPSNLFHFSNVKYPFSHLCFMQKFFSLALFPCSCSCSVVCQPRQMF